MNCAGGCGKIFATSLTAEPGTFVHRGDDIVGVVLDGRKIYIHDPHVLAQLDGRDELRCTDDNGHLSLLGRSDSVPSEAALREACAKQTRYRAPAPILFEAYED